MLKKEQNITLDAKLAIVKKMLNRLDYPESAKAIEEAEQLIEELKTDAQRYRWLRDNKHLDIWWSVEGPANRCENIDVDIDEAMSESKE
jgi:uncharacterized membrane protein YgaE (UPF0421/DUF939 family)